ncbi:MAG: hypothetical protein U9N85_05475, partial [Bacteroidota bacterium]|nr:hypothetical protein [Bacteroidota bacterium]
QTIIDKATQKLPENRYLSCTAFIDDLKKPEAPKEESFKTEELGKETNSNKRASSQKRKNVSGEKTVVYNKRKKQPEKESEKSFEKEKTEVKPESEPKQKAVKRRKKLPIIIIAILLSAAGIIIYFMFFTPPTQWNETYGSADSEAHSIAQYGRGNIVSVGYTYSDNTKSLDFLVTNTDRNGNLIFDKTYGGERGDMAKDVCIAQNGNIYITGGHFYEGKSAQFWFLGLDKKGNLITDKKFGEDEWDEANAIIETSDNNFILVGIGKIRSSDKTTLVYKVNENGNVLKKNTVGFESGYAKDIIQADNGNFVLAGVTGKYKKKAACIFLNENLREINRFEIGGNEQFFAQSIVQLSENRFVLVGNTINRKETGLARISIINDYGHLQHEYFYERYPESRFNSIIKTSDGNLLAAGYRVENKENENIRKGLLIKFSENLDVLWVRSYRQIAVIRQVVETKDGGIAFSGYRIREEKKRFKVVKANEQGEIYQY